MPTRCRRLLLSGLVFLACAARAAADDAPKPAADPVAAARAAWTRFSDAAKAAKAASEKMRTARTMEDMRRLDDDLVAANKARDAADAEFACAFGACDWDKLDAAKDTELLVAGLATVGRSSMEHGDPVTAKRAYSMLVERFPVLIASPDIRLQLADACCQTGDLPRAIKEVKATIPHLGDETVPRVVNALGDLQACVGDLDAARASWTTARDKATDDRGRRAPERSLAMVGKPAPELHVKAWFGGEAKTFASLVGDVVVVHAFNGDVQPDRALIRALDDLVKSRGKVGLVVLGVTTPWLKSSSLPAPGVDWTKEYVEKASCREVPTTTDKEFEDYVRQFHEAVGVGYPMAVVDSEADAALVRHSEHPTCVVLDRKGNVAYVDSTSKGALLVLVERLLAEPAPK